MSKSLKPYETVYVDTKSVLFGAFIFALAFWIIGSLFRYYIPFGV